MDNTTDFSGSHDYARNFKINARPIGTPYIEIRDPAIQFINPANNPSMSYSVIVKSPLNLSYKDLYI